MLISTAFCFVFYRYVAQVYYLITKIKWEYDTPPNILKGGTVILSFFGVQTFHVLCVWWSDGHFPSVPCSPLWCRPGNAHQPRHGNALSEWHKRPAVGLRQHRVVAESGMCRRQRCYVCVGFVCLWMCLFFFVFVKKIKVSHPQFGAYGMSDEAEWFVGH